MNFGLNLKHIESLFYQIKKILDEIHETPEGVLPTHTMMCLTSGKSEFNPCPCIAKKKMFW
jgi:hypothetical protein